MHLLSIQVGRATPMEIGGRMRHTAIDKQAVDGPKAIGRMGVDGDTQVARKHHGGPDQAVYVYSAADYAWWSRELSSTLAPGTFGENLTVSELGDTPLHVGDRLSIGAVLLEVTAPRIPCNTLAARMGDRHFVKRFRDAERPGVYCRVVEPGQVSAGDRVAVIPGERLVSVIEIFRLFHDTAADADRIRNALRAPLAERARDIMEKRLRGDA